MRKPWERWVYIYVDGVRPLQLGAVYCRGCWAVVQAAVQRGAIN